MPLRNNELLLVGFIPDVMNESVLRFLFSECFQFKFAYQIDAVPILLLLYHAVRTAKFRLDSQECIRGANAVIQFPFSIICLLWFHVRSQFDGLIELVFTVTERYALQETEIQIGRFLSS
jgi:hypothetical protein